MENRKRCSIRWCSANPENVCFCEEKPALFCNNHIESHKKLERNHNCLKIFSKIEDETRKLAFQLFSSVKLEIKKISSKIINEDLLLIKQCNETAQKALKELQNYDKKITKILYQISSANEIDNSKPLSFVESLLKEPFINISEIKKIQLPTLYINRIKDELFSQRYEFVFPDHQKNDYYELFKTNPICMKFILDGKNILGVFDPDKGTLSKINILLKNDHKLNQYGAKCILPDGSLFYFNREISIIIDWIGNSHYIAQYKSSVNACAVYLDGWIYLFGGDNNNSEKYSIDENRWVSLRPAPFSDANYANCAVYKKCILLSSSNSNKVFYYDTSIDSYSTISSLYAYPSYKMFLVDNDTVFYFQFPTYIYESNDNLITWNNVGRCSILENPLTSYSVKYEGKAYFVNNDAIYSFDFAIKIVSKVLDSM